MRIAFFGLPLAACLLAADGHDLCLAVLSPVPAPGRRRLARWLSPERIQQAPDDAAGEALVEDLLRRHAPDLIVSWFYTRKLSESWLGLAKLGAIGCHPSLLPRHRGPDPYFWAIDGGDSTTGVTVHRLDGEYDTGDIVLQESLPIDDRSAWQLARALDRPSLRLLRSAVSNAARSGAVVGTPQSADAATWAPPPTGDLLRVHWSWPTERILRRIRALSPTPGLALQIGELRFEVTQATRAPEYPSVLEPGEAAALAAPARLVIRTGDGAIEVLRATLEDDGDYRPADGAELAALVAGRQQVLDSASSEDSE